MTAGFYLKALILVSCVTWWLYTIRNIIVRKTALLPIMIAQHQSPFLVLTTNAHFSFSFIAISQVMKARNGQSWPWNFSWKPLKTGASALKLIQAMEEWKSWRVLFEFKLERSDDDPDWMRRYLLVLLHHRIINLLAIIGILVNLLLSTALIFFLKLYQNYFRLLSWYYLSQKKQRSIVIVRDCERNLVTY